ncbi:MAG: ATP-binding cassette domain-containing protein [Lachnospiraceae bacterium]|nr:ATP-binding cassette domain-containing protein [Lachnospiraceae bacterium]
MTETPLLTVSNLKQYYGTGKKRVRAVEDVSFTICPEETFALVGESGSGKTTVGRTIIRILPPKGGKILFGGKDISGKLSGEERKELSRKLQMIFQDPMSSLNPSEKAGDIIARGLDIHRLYSSRTERREKVLSIMKEVGLPEEAFDRYPSQFSGGQRQRIAIARALIMNPELLIADEPVSALDVSVRAQIINLLKELQRKRHIAMLFIAHDLALVRQISDRVGVMHEGKLIETGTAEKIFGHPSQPYTKKLLDSVPVLYPEDTGSSGTGEV